MEETKISMEAVEAFLAFLRGSYDTAMAQLGLDSNEIDRVNGSVDDSLRLALKLVGG